MVGLASCAIARPALGQNTGAPVIIQPQFQATAGTPLALGKLCSYAAGTSTPLATFSERTLTTPNSNPMVLTAGGLLQAQIYLDSVAYKFVVRTAGADGTCATGTVVSTLDYQYDLAALYRASFATKLDDMVCHASQYTGTTPNNAGGKIAACVTVLPSTGGTIDVRGLEGAQAWTTCPFTGVTKPVSVLMAAGTTTVSANCTVPASVAVSYDVGSIMSVNTSITLTHVGQVTGTVSQHFTGAGSVVFTGNATGIILYSEWWDSDADIGLNLAIAACATGGTLKLVPGKTYTLSARLNLVTCAMTIDGYGATLDASSITGVSANPVLQMGGNASATTTTQTILSAIGASSITVASVSGFAAGDMIKISSTESFSPTGVASYDKGELNYIDSIGGLVITLRDLLKEGYAVAGETVTITKLNPVQAPKILGLTLVCNGVSADALIGISVKYSIAPVINEVTVTDCSSTGIDFDHVDHGVISNSYVRNTNDITTPTGYAFSFTSFTQFSSVVNCHVDKARHGFTTGGYYPVWNWTVQGCTMNTGVNSVSGGIVTHANGINGLISGNNIDGFSYGVNLENPRNTVVGNVFTNCWTQCILASVDGAGDILIDGNTMRGVSGVGIAAWTGSATPSIQVSNNQVTGVSVTAIAVENGINVIPNNAKVFGNTIIATQPGIRVDGNETEVSNNTIIDVLAGARSYGIWLNTSSTTTGANVHDNKIFSRATPAMAYGIIVAASVSDSIIRRNAISDALTSTFSDSGTRTIYLGNIQNEVLQQVSVLGATAGVGQATTNGYARSTVAIKYELNGRVLQKASTDDLWNLTAVTTGVGEYKTVLFCLDDAGAASIVQGVVGNGYSTALIPKYFSPLVVPVGAVVLPPSYSGGALSGGTFLFFDIAGTFSQ